MGLTDDTCTGFTGSTNYPTKDPIQVSNAGKNDAFITKINAAGSALVYSTYLGGNSNEEGDDIAVDEAGNAFVAGLTSSTNFPTKNPIQASNAGSSDAFVTKINADGSTLVYSTYLGGNSHDYGDDIALDSSGKACVAGNTRSTNFPTQNPYQSANAGGNDAFVAVVSQWPSQTDYVLLPPDAQIADAYHVAVIGDSVAWGNGLKRENTYYYLVADWLRKVLNRPVEVRVYAHSGATIVGQTCENIDPAFSSGCPTLMDQANSIQNAADVDLILVSGGGNDVGVMNILDYNTPAHTITLLSLDIELKMTNLLKYLLDKTPNAKIIVTNYYPLFGDSIGLTEALLIWGYYQTTNAPDDLLPRLKQNADIFYGVSTSSLAKAVTQADVLNKV